MEKRHGVAPALCYLIFDLHVPKGYIYFAMAFSVSVEMLNLKMRQRMKAPPENPPVRLHKKMGTASPE